MKKILFITILMIASLSLFSEAVDQSKAASIAQNWHSYQSSESKDATIISNVEEINDNFGVSLYVFYFENGGFVVVSGDDCIKPVLGYSTVGNNHDLTNIPQVNSFLNHYVEQIEYAKAQKFDNRSTINEWNNILSNDFSNRERDVVIEPLLSTEWDQNYPYNADCPVDAAGPGGHVYAGCVATALAQVMKYWEYPDVGVGSHSYYHPAYGLQAASFEDTNYDWDNMPVSLNSANQSQIDEVARLLYHLGVATEMGYAPDGSGTHAAAYHLENYFTYSETTSLLYKDNYSDAIWKNTLKAELQSLRPMYYTGHEWGGSGHAFVCDGYNDDDYFHFNWGWSGSGDGFFQLDGMDVSGYNFNYTQTAMVGTIPEGLSCENTAVEIGSLDTAISDYFNVSVSTFPLIPDWVVMTYDFDLYYDIDKLEIVGTTIEGTIAEDGTIQISENEPGHLEVSYTSNSWIVGRGDLLNLEFRAINAGETILDIENFNYNGFANNNITDGNITIQGVGNINDVEFTASREQNVNPGQDVDVSVSTSWILPEWDVTAYQFTVEYNTEFATYNGFSVENTLSDGGIAQVNETEPGVIEVGFMGTSAIERDGDLIKLNFHAIGNGNAACISQINLSDCYINETPVTNTTNGFIWMIPGVGTEEVFEFNKESISIYPNPFSNTNIRNNGITISFNLPKSSNVKVEVFNLIGQLVKTLADDDFTKGNNTITWDAKENSTGIYFTKIKTDFGTKVSKVLIVK